MNLLFGRQRSLLGSQQRQQLFREMPRLPLPLRPLQGELAATLNNATRGYDVGQAGPIWVSVICCVVLGFSRDA